MRVVRHGTKKAFERGSCGVDGGVDAPCVVVASRCVGGGGKRARNRVRERHKPCVKGIRASRGVVVVHAVGRMLRIREQACERGVSGRVQSLLG